MALFRTLMRTLVLALAGVAHTPWLMSAAPAAPINAAAVLAADPDDSGNTPDSGDVDEDGPPPCLPGNTPSAVTGRCVPDFPEHICPDGGLSVWNRCPRSAPCPDGGASVNGVCSGDPAGFVEIGTRRGSSVAMSSSSIVFG